MLGKNTTLECLSIIGSKITEEGKSCLVLALQRCNRVLPRLYLDDEVPLEHRDSDHMRKRYPDLYLPVNKIVFDKEGNLRIVTANSPDSYLENPEMFELYNEKEKEDGVLKTINISYNTNLPDSRFDNLQIPEPESGPWQGFFTVPPHPLGFDYILPYEQKPPILPDHRLSEQPLQPEPGLRNPKCKSEEDLFYKSTKRQRTNSNSIPFFPASPGPFAGGTTQKLTTEKIKEKPEEVKSPLSPKSNFL